MKKLIYCALALAAGLFAASCQQKNLEPVAQENTVTYTVELPGVETKAIADGSNVNRLYYEVWKIDAKNVNAENVKDVRTTLTDDGVATRLYQKDIPMTPENEVGPAKTVVTLNLVQDQKYIILFWAQNNNALGENSPAYNTANLTAVTYVDAILNDKKTPANNENLAAFYAVDFVLEGDPKSKTIYLKRPFAQLNIGTLNTVDKNEYTIAMQESQVTVSSVPTVFNVATSIASREVKEFEFTSALLPNNPTTLQANDVTYQYAAMNYIFANNADAEGQSPATVEVDFNIKVELSATDVATPTTTEATINHNVPNVPLSQNYRTNIVGNLLTSETEYNVIVDPNWAGEDLEPAALYLAAALGGEVALDDDYVLTSPVYVTKDMKLNLNGKTLTGTIEVKEGVVLEVTGGKIVNEDNTTSAITSNGILILNDVEITSARHALRIESGEAIINGGTYKVEPISASTLYALNVGDGANSVANVTIKGGTFIGPKGTMADSGGAVGVKVGSTVKIEGGDFSGGKPHTLSGKGTIAISGGSFDQEPSAEWLADGLSACKSGDKWYVVPEGMSVTASAEDLIAQIAVSGNICLLNDIELNDRLDIQPGVDIRLDLNGKTLTSSADYMFIIRDGGSLVVEGNGYVEVAPNAVLFYPAGNLTIENGTFVRNIPEGYTGELGSMFTGTKPAAGWEATGVTINGGYFDGGYYNANAADIEDLLAGKKTLEETADDVKKRGVSGDKNVVRVALKENVMKSLNRSNNYFKIYGGTFVGVNPAWGDEGCMLPTTPNYLRPWSYYQGALLDGQTFHEDGIVLPEGYAIEKTTHEDGRPIYTVTYNK